MKLKLTALLVFLVIINVFPGGDEFLRDLPKTEFLKLITPETFPGMDAVIILKEQSYMISPTTIDYRGYTFTGPQTVVTKILIVKLLDELAVKKYGTFEFMYRENFGDDIPNGFGAKARVLKENGDIFELDEDEIHNIVVVEDSHGDPLIRKAYFKVPNLVPGDVLQIEYQFGDVFSRTYSGIFFYNDRDYTLFSNLYITLPAREEFDITSLPEKVIGKPKIEQISNDWGTGKTYFWGLKNLNEIPDEIYSRPFEDRSMITAFVVKSSNYHENSSSNWLGLGTDFFDSYVKKGDIDEDDIEKLGFSPDSEKINSMQIVDKVYQSLRKYFQLLSVNSLYPRNEHISDLFEEKKGDASDLSIIMYKMLKHWGVECNCVMIRDRRKGVYEESIPTTVWFNRLGLLVKIKGKEKLYDFDKCISTNYSFPWYLNGIKVFVLDGLRSYHKRMNTSTGTDDNYESETHMMTFDQEYHLKDNLDLCYKGCFEDELRGEFYSSEKKEVEDYFTKLIEADCLSEADSILINDYQNENSINISALGQSLTKPEIVDSFIVIKLKDLILNNFKDKIYTVKRKTDMVFDSPFKFNMKWEINLPDGYKYNDDDETKMIKGPGKCQSTIKISSDDTRLIVSAEIRFPDQYVKVSDYPVLMMYIDNSLMELDKDLILKKGILKTSGI